MTDSNRTFMLSFWVMAELVVAFHAASKAKRARVLELCEAGRDQDAAAHLELFKQVMAILLPNHPKPSSSLAPIFEADWNGLIN